MAAPGVSEGLTQTEAQARLRTEGYNELPAAAKRDIPAIALDVLREPMFLLLVCAGGIYFLLGDTRDALLLLGFVFVVLGITLYQEYKTERVLQALRDLSSPRARVVRDGEEIRIAGREVARGDLLLFSEGDRVAADGVLLSCNNLALDESLLTGESVPVRQHTPDEAAGQGSPDSVCAGTLVVSGRGMARVTATGPHTEMGKIGRALQEQETEPSPLQREIGKLVRRIAIIGVLISLLLVAIYGLMHGAWLHGLLSGITLAMSILPEEYPLMLTVFLAMGAWRISQRRVLTRRVPTIEALGSATVLCVDKTGTLTHNRMRVRKLSIPGAEYDVEKDSTPLPEAFHALMEFAILSSEVAPYDPMELAIHEMGLQHLADTEHIHEDWELVHAYSLSPQLLALSHVWRAHDRAEYVVAAKGSPEAIADLCHFDAAQLAELETQVNSLAEQGMRVLGVARALYDGPEWPEIQHEFEFEFVGLVGLADPVRASAPAALQECSDAGIRVVMITGDYPATAAAIAREIGMDAGDGIITGPELAQMDATGQRDCVQQHLCACRARAEAAAGQRAQGQRRSGGDDRRRRQRRTRAEGRPHRHRHGRARLGRGARSLRAGAAGRRLRRHRARRAHRAAHLRQPAQGDGLYLCRAPADRGPVAGPVAAGLAGGVHAGAYRLP